MDKPVRTTARASQPWRGSGCWALLVLVLLAAAAVAYQLWASVPAGGVYAPLTHFDGALREVQEATVRNLRTPRGDAYAYGRWRRPVADLALIDEDAPTVAAAVQRALVRKRWAYMSVDTPRFFVAAALVQFGYVADVFLYLVDKDDGGSGRGGGSGSGAGGAVTKWEYASRRPFGVGVTFAPSSVDGCTTWAPAAPFDPAVHAVALCYEPDQGVYRLDANVNVVRERCIHQGRTRSCTSPPLSLCPRANAPSYGRAHGHAEGALQTSARTGATRAVAVSVKAAARDGLALLFPLDNSGMRPAYTHKAAGMHAVGELHWTDAAGVHEEHYLAGTGAARPTAHPYPQAAIVD
jgi:hypothetical protein